MKERKSTHINAEQEVNLKLFFQKAYKNKWLFLASIGSFLALAIGYISLTTPKYEVSTSILIDTSGSNRVLGESRYVDGGVSLIEMEKNLYNEIGIIKSFSLIEQTVEDLGFGVSYHAGNWLKEKEHYGYFPFEVVLTKGQAQLYDIPFKVKILSNEKYRLSVEGSDFTVSNPNNGSTREVTRNLNFSKVFEFGKEAGHDYFTFVIKRPYYDVNAKDFEGDDLSFIVHNLDDTTNSYMASLSVENIDLQASIFKIVTTGAVVQKEIDFLQKLTENYIRNKLVSRNNIASDKEAFIRNQLREVSDSLTRVELKLELFKKNKRALNLSATATNALGRTSNLRAEEAKIELNIKFYNSLIESVQSNRNTEDFVIPTAVGIEDPLINANIIELKDLYAERTKKKFYLTDTNQEMTILNKQIKESTDLLLNNLRNAIQSSEFALQRVTDQLSNYGGVISSLPTRENELLNIERQSTLYENLFNYLSQELAKTGIARAENTSDTQVLDEARMVGDGPITPQKKLLLVLATVLGTLIPLAWMVWFAPNDTIENIDQITENSEIPVIASIVHHDATSKNSNSDASLWKLKESFRFLSTNVRFLNSKKQCVLGITSIMPREGKTYNAINLGITFAEAGKKTLIIDADLRNPSLVKSTYKVGGKGLSDYLLGDVTSVDDIIFAHEELSKLEFIPTSIVNGNVHEILSGSKMKSLISELKAKYDYIILDTPPAGLVSDFLQFRDLIDINLFVVRRKVAKIAFLNDLEKLIPKGKKKKSFIIFNDVLKKDHNYGYQSTYGINTESQVVNDYLSV
ncbi:MAG: GumC family protein [Aurantibacter sp.]